MNRADLIRIHPWANKPDILEYAEKLTAQQWGFINDAGLPDLLPRMEPIHTQSIFQAFSMMVTMGMPLELTIQAMIESLKTQLTVSPTNPSAVLNWLGTELSKRVELDVTSYAMMDDIVSLLSSKEARVNFEKPLVSMDRRINGKYIRELYRTRQITVQDFINILKGNSTPIQRQFPAWVVNHVEIRKLANEFSDEQLAALSTIINNSISRDRDLCCAFLRTVLAKLSFDGQNKVSECPIDAFQLTALSLQQQFISLASQQSVRFNADFVDSLSRLDLGLGTNSRPFINSIIKRHVSKYSKCVAIPAQDEMNAMQFALRNAANTGNYWDLLALIYLVSDINSKGGESGKTALHRAVDYMNKTGNRLCFDLLANQPNIDFSVKDSAGKTALDYWDFAKFPDDNLSRKLSSLNAQVEERGASSALTSNSVFQPASAASAPSASSAFASSSSTASQVVNASNEDVEDAADEARCCIS